MLLSVAGCSTLTPRDRRILLSHEVSQSLYQKMEHHEPLTLSEIVELSHRGVPGPFIVHYLRPTYFGHSVGRWENDTLVVDTVGFNEKQWIVGSYPTTERLHMTERFARPDVRTLSYEATIDDPGAYTKPWTIRWTISATSKSSWMPGGEIFEYICQGD